MTWADLSAIWAFVGPVAGFALGIGTRWANFLIREQFDIKKADIELISAMVRNGNDVLDAGSTEQFSWLEKCRRDAILLRGRKRKKRTEKLLDVASFNVEEITNKLRSLY